MCIHTIYTRSVYFSHHSANPWHNPGYWVAAKMFFFVQISGISIFGYYCILIQYFIAGGNEQGCQLKEQNAKYVAHT